MILISGIVRAISPSLGAPMRKPNVIMIMAEDVLGVVFRPDAVVQSESHALRCFQVLVVTGSQGRRLIGVRGLSLSRTHGDAKGQG